MSTTSEEPSRRRLPALRALLRDTQAVAQLGLTHLEPRPDAVAGLHRAGPRAYRVLMFGGGVLEGRGLRIHDLGLPGHVASLLAARSRRGVDLDVIVDADPTGNIALNGLRGLRLNRYDGAIVVLGERYAAARMPAGKWEILFASLAQVLLSQAARTAPLFVWDAAHVSSTRQRQVQPRAQRARRTARRGHRADVRAVAADPVPETRGAATTA